MGLLDSLKEQALGKVMESVGQQNSPMAGVVKGLLGGESGNLQGLLKAFQDKGLGNIVSSWIAQGQNLPVTAQQLQSVLGNEKIQALAKQFGLSTDTLTQQLAQHLPAIIDKLTPNGKLPDNA